MSRTTIDFGIDLGTTNSAIAVLNGVTTEIIKNNDDADVTPSAVAIDRKGTTTYVGLRARNRAIENHQDTYLEFKRRMGSDFCYEFKSSGIKRTPEELSAEVLKSLRADVQQRTGEMVETAVITVPAAFELQQCEATRKAAILAGFNQSPLLQEPVAAALAYGFQASNASSYWLVYDFGGGTFDVALMKAEEGMIDVVNHGGDNFLGGSDIDWALVEKVIVPKFLEQFKVPEFDRAHAGPGQRWRQIFAKFKWVGEDAKIQLTRRDKVVFEVKDLREEGGDFTCEFFECEIGRDELIRVAEPIIRRSVDICQRVLKEKNLGKNAIEKMILVGGPTLAPYFREILSATCGIPLDFKVDPLTVVARGAAVFAGAQPVGTRRGAAVAVGDYAIDLKHKPMGGDSAPMVGGRISGQPGEDFTGFTLEIVNTKTLWRSGKITLGSEGVFTIDLHAEKGERNVYAIELFDAAGRKRKTTPEELTYTIGAVVEEQPLINSMGIALASNEYDRLFEKGRGLPLKAQREYRTMQAVRHGESGGLLKAPIVEGEHSRADRNRLIGVLEIKGDAIRRDLPSGSEVEVTLRVDTSRLVTAMAYVPLLDQEFAATLDLQKVNPSADFLKTDFEAEMKRFREIKAKAGANRGDTAGALLADVEVSPLMEEVKQSLAAAPGDPDAAAKCEKRLLELKLKLDEASDALEWPTLVTQTREWQGHLQRMIAVHGDRLLAAKAPQLDQEIEEIIREGKPDRLRQKMEQTKAMYLEIAATQPAWWVHWFQQLEKQRRRMTDPDRTAQLINQGQDCLAKNNVIGLQNVVRQLWELAPKDVMQAAQRGYQSGLLR
jgi:molecular chaperone DnaK